MNRIDALGLTFHDEASGRFNCVLEKTIIQYSGSHSTSSDPNSQDRQILKPAYEKRPFRQIHAAPPTSAQPQRSGRDKANAGIRNGGSGGTDR